MLKALEVSGFKSFAKKTELQFKSPITAIVGPNGSGKSNVAEAFRFVLGEQSMKSMRGKRGEDLIWNGSAEMQKSNRASVKLIFNNSKNLFSSIEGLHGNKSFEFEEVSIERSVNRDGSNEYFVNGSPVRLKDIVMMLSQAHIGSSGHHIISQGEADRILSANMKERRAMIEDALGLKVFQYKREESERKLQKTEENIRQVESLRREIAPHIRFLKKQVEKLEKAEEIRKKLVISCKEYLKSEKIYLDYKESLFLTQKDPIEEKLKALELQMEEAKNLLQNSSKKDLRSEAIIDMESRIKKERSERDELYRDMGKIEGELHANERLLERLKRDLSTVGAKNVPLSELEELERELSQYSDISVIFLKLREFIEKHKSSSEHGNIDEIEGVSRILESKREQFARAIEAKDNLIQELNRNYSDLRLEIEKEKDTERDAEKNIFKISAEINESRSKLEAIREKVAVLEKERADWKREAEEGAVLLGVEVLRFEDAQVGNTDDLEQFVNDYSLVKDEKRRELEKFKIRLEELGAGGGEDVSKEYKETIERDEFLKKELEDLKTSAESLKNLIKDLIEKLDSEFKNGLHKINNKFEEFFKIMFDGGSAELKIERLKIKRSNDLNIDSEINSAEFKTSIDIGSAEEETEEGIEILVSLPRKRIKGLDMLSGGERALTSIALLFAISQVNPPPFIILDETDAALDEANSKKYGDMIESLSRVSQLILITHNRETMSRAGVIYGVTMGRDGVSRLLSIAFDQAVVVAK